MSKTRKKGYAKVTSTPTKILIEPISGGRGVLENSTLHTKAPLYTRKVESNRMYNGAFVCRLLA